MNDDFLGRLNPESRKRILEAYGHEPELLETPSLGLTLALKGGFGEGRQIFLWGSKSAGKSSFCLQQIGIAQKLGKVCAWIDVENSFAYSWAERLGVDTKNLILSKAKTTNHMANLVVDMMQAGIDLVVVDSISALLPGSFIADKKAKGQEFELKPMENTGQIGAASKDAGAYMSMFNAVNENTVLILISQARTAFAGQHATFAPTGGHAARYYSSQSIKLWSSESKDNTIEDMIQAGDQLIKVPVGRKVIWKVEFNKLGPQGRSGEYDFFYEGPRVGIDRQGEIVDLATIYGVLEFGKSGWSEWNGEKVQGRDNMVQLFRNNPAEFDKLRAQLEERL